MNGHPVGPGILREICTDAGGLPDFALCQGIIVFVYGPVSQAFGKLPCSGERLCGKHNSACIAVDPVDHRGTEDAETLLCELAFFGQV